MASASTLGAVPWKVYYDDDGRPEARTERPVHPAGKTWEELEADVQAYLGALQEPILEDTVFRQAIGGLFNPEGDDGP